VASSGTTSSAGSTTPSSGSSGESSGSASSGTGDDGGGDATSSSGATSGATSGAAASGTSSGASSGSPPPPPIEGFAVLTNRYDNNRSSSNPHETILTTSNVVSGKFGLKWSAPVTGRVYGHVLYVPGLMVNGAKHNVVYIATEHNIVYAFDEAGGMPLWTKTLEPSWVPGQNGFTPNCGDMTGMEAGITGTPVISLDTNAIYVAAKTLGKWNLHGLDLTTGNDLPGSPAVLSPGGAGFAPEHQLNRPGLLLVSGIVYVAFGSHCDDAPWHGWVLGYDAKSFTFKYSVNTTPNSAGGAIWMSGTGPSSDGTSIYFAAGNETGNMAPPATSLSMCVIQTDLTLKVVAHHQEPVRGDNDLVTGVILVGNQVLAGGKSGQVTLLNKSDLSLAQRVQAGGETHNIATWNGPSGTMIYTCDTGASPHAWLISGGMLVDKGTSTAITGTGHPGGMITTSSNGTMAGTGIVWISAPTGQNAWHMTSRGILIALDATDITKPALWTSAMAPTDAIATWAKFSPPIVANGQVYVATFDNKLLVYGLK
jgi:hypothetical protein